jgi:tRNA (guanine37-N1)-methyltransferase
MFGPFLGTSIPGRAADKGLVEYRLHNIRDAASDRHRSVDDRSFGGGPGMVMMAPVVVGAVERAIASHPVEPAIVLLTPQGGLFDQAQARSLAGRERLLLICGRYEGFDQRIVDVLRPVELSIGDYVLSGGELAAMVVIDAVVRLLPGAIGAEGGTDEETFSDGLLEHPQYTRPREFRGLEVPAELLSGDHRAIAAWRKKLREDRTRERRPDLFEKYVRIVDRG